MPMDRSFVALNRAATQRMHALAARLTDEELQHPVGEHWTVAIALAHIAFWDRRALHVLDLSEREGRFTFPQLDDFVNDLSLPLWAAVPPRHAARIALESAQALDARLEAYPSALLEEFYAANPAFVLRAVHRGLHLDEVDAALAAP
jgi:uncharacterized damage-inducible protein DinB